MKIKTLIHSITGEETRLETHIPTGLTNTNIHVRTDANDYVLRLPKPENKHLFNYAHEAHVLNLIKPLHLEPELIYYDSLSGTKLSQYIEDAETLSPIHYLDAVTLIAQLHNANLHSGVQFNLTSKWQLYQADRPIYDLRPYTHYIEDAIKLSDNLRLCHNDCVEGNFLFTPTRHYLIDYEYACDNDPYFDLLSLITENDIMDPEQRQAILDAYFSLVDIPYDAHKFTVFEGALQVLWCAWACSMYETFKEPIFKEIADLKYLRLTQLTTVTNN